MRVIAFVREVSPDDESMYRPGPDGSIFMGYPLRNYLSNMDADGYIRVPLPPGARVEADSPAAAAPEMSLVNAHVDPDVHIDMIDASTVRISIAKWRERDPDNTFLRVGFQLMPASEAERAALDASTGPTEP
jgi:hypothetical protein